MNYYQIIPLAKLSIKTRPFFTYQSEMTGLEKSLVEIAFGRKKTRGIVIKRTRKPLFPARKISRFIEKNFITDQQLKLAEKISDYYLTGLGVVLKSFVVKKTKKNPPLRSERQKKETFPHLTANQKFAYKKIARSSKREFALYGPASSGKTEIIMGLVGDAIKKKKQALIIIPEIFLSYQEIRRYQKRFPDKKIALLHSGLKTSEITAIWENCKNGKLDVLISTKVGLFSPFKNLGFIAVDEEQDSSHKQWDLSPRYHSRKVAFFLSDIWKTKLIYASATPSLEIAKQFSFEKQKDGFITLPMLKKKGLEVKKPRIDFSDLKKYFFQKKTNQIFFKEAKKAIAENLGKKRLVFVLVPRRGKSRITICNECKKILSCPKCQTPLIQIGDKYQCIHCNFKQSGFSSCPHCKSFQLKNIGAGTEKAVGDLKILFPEARIRQADQTIFRKNSQREKLLADILEKKVDILVGTQAIIKGFDFPDLNLAIVVNAESWGAKADYKFDERWLGNLFQLAGRVNRPGSDQEGRVVIQTYQKENPLFNFLVKWDWLGFIAEEMFNRKNLKYPPFWKLVKLTCKNPDLEKTEKYAKNIYTEALKIGLDASVPYWGVNKKIRTKFEKNILIKTKSTEIKNVKKLVERLGNNWKVDVDPENIF